MKNVFYFWLPSLFPINGCKSADSSWFTVKEVAKEVWQINDRGANIYLIIGHDSAWLLIPGSGLPTWQGQIGK